MKKITFERIKKAGLAAGATAYSIQKWKERRKIPAAWLLEIGPKINVAPKNIPEAVSYD